MRTLPGVLAFSASVPATARHEGALSRLRAMKRADWPPLCTSKIFALSACEICVYFLVQHLFLLDFSYIKQSYNRIGVVLQLSLCTIGVVWPQPRHSAPLHLPVLIMTAELAMASTQGARCVKRVVCMSIVLPFLLQRTQGLHSSTIGIPLATSWEWFS